MILTGLLFLSGLASSGVTTGSGGTTSGGGGRSNVGEESSDVLSLEGLGEETGPVALNSVSASLNDLAELLFL